MLTAHFGSFFRKDVSNAIDKGYAEREKYLALVRAKGEEFLNIARAESRQVIVLAGRPYHVDPEINHGIANLICELGAIVITEDSISNRVEKFY